MVSVNLVGRMANQMFQIACCIAYALRNGLEYHIPAHTLNDKVWKPVFTHLENPNWNPKLPSVLIREESHSYKEIPKAERRLSMVIMNKGDVTDDILVDYNIIIDGYRQSIKYFEDYLPEVRKAFGFSYQPITILTASLHIRLGDYKIYPTKHPIINNDYIRRAIIKMVIKGACHIIVFSDEIDEAQKIMNVVDASESVQITYSRGKSELNDFQEMLNHTHFIISNSTYSLMAAILSESNKKIVISPSKDNWFGEGNKHLSTDDIIPDSFIQLKY